MNLLALNGSPPSAPGVALLKQIEKAKGTPGQHQGSDVSGDGIVRAPENETLTLADRGITNDQSSQRQELACGPERLM
jgi:hypothetical protein